MKRTAKAHWEGTLKEGKGNISLESGVLEQANYSFKTRFEEGEKGTNPEELLAAAHAGCFTMAVGALLTSKGYKPTTLDTEAVVSMKDLTITGIHLIMNGGAEGISIADFEAVVKEAEKTCIISKALSVPITSEIRFI